jgi:hypothetical protein
MLSGRRAVQPNVALVDAVPHSSAAIFHAGRHSVWLELASAWLATATLSQMFCLVSSSCFSASQAD